MLESAHSFIETFPIRFGKVGDMSYHWGRMRKTMHDHDYPITHLRSIMREEVIEQLIPKDGCCAHLLKGRILYDAKSYRLECEAYIPKEIDSLLLVVDDAIDYSYKYANRAKLNALRARYNHEILIVKNGNITDTSFSNVVLERNGIFFTPDSYLLNGTKRQELLEMGTIQELSIMVDDLSSFEKIYLINAMRDLATAVGIPITQIGMPDSY